MLGAILAGVNCWDRAESGSGRWWLLPAWLLLAVGLAAKITAAFVLVPLGLVIVKPRSARKIILAASSLAPVLLWYAWANHLVDTGVGSRASAENRAIWTALFGAAALTNPDTLIHIGRFLCVRAFTPLGMILAVWGLCQRPLFRDERDREALDLWRSWGVAALVMLALLAGKLHHEYYFLSLAPVLAAGLGRVSSRLKAMRPGLAWGAAAGFLLLSALLARSTWQTPTEWKDLQAAASVVQGVVPEDAWLVAAEPLIYQSNRRGCRLEFTPQAAARAAAEWPGETGTDVNGPVDLIDFYRRQGHVSSPM
jgi:4-amino-4-deoxy-L-arabinose transferase-like glycosyltransferase